jgi:hypothetical protein
MYVVDLYNGIYRTLANDVEILELLGITDTDKLTRAKKIQKRAKPQDLATNIPIITFYTPGGTPDPINDLVYGATFVFDIYTNDDVDKAHKISNRIFRIFHKEIPKFEGLETTSSKFEDAHESATDLTNTYCFTIVITMFVSTEQ